MTHTTLAGLCALIVAASVALAQGKPGQPDSARPTIRFVSWKQM